jgi:hypothetical protein
MLLLTLEGVARYLGVSSKTARGIAKDLPAVRVGKRNRWSVDVVASFANKTPSVRMEQPAE